MLRLDKHQSREGVGVLKEAQAGEHEETVVWFCCGWLTDWLPVNGQERGEFRSFSAPAIIRYRPTSTTNCINRHEARG